jgi:hypothetical protein
MPTITRVGGYLTTAGDSPRYHADARARHAQLLRLSRMSAERQRLARLGELVERSLTDSSDPAQIVACAPPADRAELRQLLAWYERRFGPIPKEA